MPDPPRKLTGRGFRGAFIMLVGLIAIVIAFSFNYAGTEIITFPYDNGKMGTAFYYKSPGAQARPRPIILFIHGYNNLKTFDFRLLEFTRRGWDVLSIDLPGHGTNSNTFKTGCWNVIFGALDYIQSRPDSWNSSAIGVVGHSFGGLVGAMGLLFDNRIAAGVLWAPLLDMEKSQARADSIFPQGHPFHRFTSADSPLTYLQSNMTLNNTLIIHGTDDSVLPIAMNLDAYLVLNATDPTNKTRHSFEPISGGDHLLYYDVVIRDTIAWLAPYLEPDRANAMIYEVETSPTVYFLYFVLEILALFGLFPAIFIIFVDEVGKSVERKRWVAESVLTIKKEEHSLPTPVINRNWKWRFIFYIIALIFIIFAGVNLLSFLLFQFQLGFMGILMSGTAFLYEYFRHRWIQHKKGIAKSLEEEEGQADNPPDPRSRRVRRYMNGMLLGIALGGTFLGAIYILTYIFGFLVVLPISVPYFIVSITVSFAFSLGIEWLFRLRIQLLIYEAELYNKRRTTDVLNFILTAVLPLMISIGFFKFAAAITPAVYLLFYSVTGLCSVINWYLFDRTHSLVLTVTFSTFVMGWILAGCLTPAFF